MTLLLFRTSQLLHNWYRFRVCVIALVLTVSVHTVSFYGLIHNCILSHFVNFNHNMSINIFTDKEISLLFDMFVTEFHERSNGCWCRVELGDLVFLANGPTSVWTRMEWCAFKLKTKRYVISHTKLSNYFVWLWVHSFLRSSNLPLANPPDQKQKNPDLNDEKTLQIINQGGHISTKIKFPVFFMCYINFPCVLWSKN